MRMARKHRLKRETEKRERGTSVRKPRRDPTKSIVFPWVEEESEFAAGTLNLPANT